MKQVRTSLSESWIEDIKEGNVYEDGLDYDDSLSAWVRGAVAMRLVMSDGDEVAAESIEIVEATYGDQQEA